MSVSVREQGAGSLRLSLVRLAGAAIGYGLGWPCRVWRARAAMASLAGMTDCELKDIGLVRQDLRDMSALPLGDDPTAILARRARDRRTRRRP